MPYKDKNKQKQWLLNYQAANRLAYIKNKEKPCTDCGKEYPHYIMEWDHVRGKKTRNIAHLALRGIHSPKVQEELAKCDLVCANCHATRTYFRNLK